MNTLTDSLSSLHPSSLTPHLHLDLIVAGYHGNGHSILIGGRWPGVAANWAFRMEGGGEAVSLRLQSCVSASVIYLCVCSKGDMLLEATKSVRHTRSKSDTRAAPRSHYVNVSLCTSWCGSSSPTCQGIFTKLLSHLSSTPERIAIYCKNESWLFIQT